MKTHIEKKPQFIILLLFACALLLTCEKIDRNNPWDAQADIDPNSWAPQNLNIELVSITERKLKWQYGDHNIEGFKVDRRVGDGNWENAFATIGKEARSWNDNDNDKNNNKVTSKTIEKEVRRSNNTEILLDNATAYSYRLYAFAGNNTSAYKEIRYVPTSITTNEATNVTGTSATSGGNVVGSHVNSRGIAYGTSANPGITGSTVAAGSGEGNFTANITGLTPNTTYFVRAYATNSAGTDYGSNVSFKTLPPDGPPQWIKYWQSGVNDSALGLGGDAVVSWYAAIRWMPNDLNSFIGYSVSKIRIYINNMPAYAYAIIWQGNINNPVVMHRQQFTPVEDGWVEITLNNPYLINTDQELWIGWEMGDQGEDCFPAAFEISDAHDGRANLLQFGNNPWQFTSVYGFSVVWNIEAYVVPWKNK